MSPKSSNREALCPCLNILSIREFPIDKKKKNAYFRINSKYAFLHFLEIIL